MNYRTFHLKKYLHILEFGKYPIYTVPFLFVASKKRSKKERSKNVCDFTNIMGSHVQCMKNHMKSVNSPNPALENQIS